MTLYKFNHPPEIMQKIRERAYEIWEWHRDILGEDRPALDNWLEAEKNILTGEY